MQSKARSFSYSVAKVGVDGVTAKAKEAAEVMDPYLPRFLGQPQGLGFRALGL